MARTTQEQRAGYPLAAYNFRVTIDTRTMSFAKVSGLQRERQTASYRHGLSFREGELLSTFGSSAYVSVTLERGVVAGASFIHQWMERPTPRAMEVSLCDGEGRPVLAWRIARAVPVKLSAPSFDARSNEVAIDSLEVKAAGITVVHID